MLGIYFTNLAKIINKSKLEGKIFCQAGLYCVTTRIIKQMAAAVGSRASTRTAAPCPAESLICGDTEAMRFNQQEGSANAHVVLAEERRRLVGFLGVAQAGITAIVLAV